MKAYEIRYKGYGSADCYPLDRVAANSSKEAIRKVFLAHREEMRRIDPFGEAWESRTKAPHRARPSLIAAELGVPPPHPYVGGPEFGGPTVYGGDTFDWRAIDFRGKDLQYIDFWGCDLRGVDFSDCNLYGAKFNGADLEGAIFDRANLACCKFKRANLRGASFQGAEAQQANFDHASVVGACFDGADLSLVSLGYTDCREADFSKLARIRADVWNTNFAGAKFPERDICPPTSRESIAYLEGHGGLCIKVRIPAGERKFISLTWDCHYYAQRAQVLSIIQFSSADCGGHYSLAERSEGELTHTIPHYTKVHFRVGDWLEVPLSNNSAGYLEGGLECSPSHRVLGE